jgi:aspartate/methionine/tyrosine aminotransferase
MVKLAGGVPKLINLAPPEWRLTREMLEAAITDRTRLVIFNNPHNPTARAFDAEEVRLLAEACVRHDALALSDEVWEHVTFDGRDHVPLASMPGMAERTVKVGSAGKIFSLTGWKVGWAVVPPDMAKAVANAHQFLTFTTAPNLQAGAAYGLGKEAAYFERMRATFAASRDFLVSGLRDAGYVVLPGEGTYFVNVDLVASGLEMDDVSFCERAVREAGVAAIPVSALYAENPVRNVIRLCFAKQEETLRAGILGLTKARTAFAEGNK